MVSASCGSARRPPSRRVEQLRRQVRIDSLENNADDPSATSENGDVEHLVSSSSFADFTFEFFAGGAFDVIEQPRIVASNHDHRQATAGTTADRNVRSAKEQAAGPSAAVVGTGSVAPMSDVDAEEARLYFPPPPTSAVDVLWSDSESSRGTPCSSACSTPPPTNLAHALSSMLQHKEAASRIEAMHRVVSDLGASVNVLSLDNSDRLAVDSSAASVPSGDAEVHMDVLNLVEGCLTAQYNEAPAVDDALLSSISTPGSSFAVRMAEEDMAPLLWSDRFDWFEEEYLAEEIASHAEDSGCAVSHSPAHTFLSSHCAHSVTDTMLDSFVWAADAHPGPAGGAWQPCASGPPPTTHVATQTIGHVPFRVDYAQWPFDVEDYPGAALRDRYGSANGDGSSSSSFNTTPLEVVTPLEQEPCCPVGG